jgi:hypothetical protein
MSRLLPVAGLLAALAVAPALAAPSPSPTQEPEDPIQVQVTRVLPRAPLPHGVVEVTGRLRNTGSAPVTVLRDRHPERLVSREAGGQLEEIQSGAGSDRG